jgi:tetratricopeptide (TPR) repeat protein
VDPIALGQNLDVRAVLTGRLVHRGNRLSIQTELVDAQTGARLWGEDYTSKLEDLHNLEQKIASHITEKLRMKIQPGRKKMRKPTEVGEAYQLYLKGRYYWNKRTVDGLEKAVDYFQQAIQQDPNYALAHAGLADAYLLNSTLPPKETADRARDAALKALALDNNLAEAHASLGFVKARYDWKWSEAEMEYRRALELNPNYAVAYYFYADYLLIMGKYDETLQVLKKAQEIDPLSVIISAELGVPLICKREYDGAIVQFQKTLELEPNYWQAHYWLGVAYHQKGMQDDSIKEFQKAATVSGESPTALAMLGYAYASSGQKRRALEIIAKFNRLSKRRNVLPSNVAMIHFGLDETDEGFKWLEKSYQAHDPSLVLIKLLPSFDNLRQDPRFTDLIRRMSLPL